MEPEEINHYAEGGPVQALWTWWEHVMGDHRSYRSAWPLMDENLRRCRSQAWLWNNRTFDEIARLGIEGLAERYIGDVEAPFWDEFAAIELEGLDEAWSWLGSTPGAASRPRLIAPDLELVVLVRTEADVIVVEDPTEMQTLPILMRMVDSGWLVASFGAEQPPTPGWPPAF